MPLLLKGCALNSGLRWANSNLTLFLSLVTVPGPKSTAEDVSGTSRWNRCLAQNNLVLKNQLIFSTEKVRNRLFPVWRALVIAIDWVLNDCKIRVIRTLNWWFYPLAFYSYCFFKKSSKNLQENFKNSEDRYLSI